MAAPNGRTAVVTGSTTDVLPDAQPTRQFVTVEQVVSLALFLCSENAAQITSANIPIDGSWTVQ